MTKALGIDIGSSFIHLVELDGSARRFKISRRLALPRHCAEEPPAGELDSEDLAPVLGSQLEGDLQRALDEFGASRDRTVLSVRGSACILRNFKVPFRGREQIRKVLKFESEGQIHSHSIDDVVVDAAVVSESDDGTELFMAACPKATLAPQIDLLARHGISPEKADLDCTLLFQAAQFTGAIPAGEPGDLDLLVGIGQSSIQLVLARGGRLATSRVLRWGLDNLEAELASSIGTDRRSLHEAMHRYFDLPTASDYDAPGEHLEGDDAEVESLLEAAPSVGVAVHEEELRGAAKRLAQRLSREVFRFLAGLRETGTLRQVVLTGGGARLPGIDQILADELQLDVSVLDLLASSTGGAESDPGFDTALAAAMAAMGTTKPTMNFRQEELAFRRRFDQLKVPIAVAVWLFLGYVVLTCYNLTVERKQTDIATGIPYPADPNYRFKTPRYSGLLQQLVSPKHGSSWLLHYVSDEKDAQALLEKVARQETPGERVRVLRTDSRNLRSRLEESTGYFREIEPPSGLAVLQAFSEVVDRCDAAPSIGRFVITEIDLNISDRNSRLSIRVGFRGQDFRSQSANFLQICKDASKEKDSPFADAKQPRDPSHFKDMDGASYQFELPLKEPMGVFQPTSFPPR